MSLQRMPILDALMDGSFYTHEIDNYRGPIGPSFRDALKDAIRIKSPHGVADGHLTSEKVPSPDEIGPQILPFNSLWIEREAPGIVIDGKFRKETVHVGHYVDVLTKTNSLRPNQSDYGYVTDTFYMFRKSIVRMRFVFLVETDKDGLIKASGPVPKMTDPLLASAGHAAARALADARSGEYLHINLAPLLTIGLMNCRNVDVREVSRPARRKGKGSRRKRIPQLSFNTIVLPNANPSGVEACHPGRAGQFAQHKVRGHFKTFTKEKPLFGKLTGTYWWGWQVRGNAANGINVNDYSLDGFEVPA